MQCFQRQRHRDHATGKAEDLRLIVDGIYLRKKTGIDQEQQSCQPVIGDTPLPQLIPDPKQRHSTDHPE